MIMKIVTYVLVVLLAVAIAASTVFYLHTYQPMTAEYQKMKAGMRELDKAKAELKRYKEKESMRTAWLKPAVEALTAGLGDEIRGGKAEVLSADNVVVVNISEDALYAPGSATIMKEGDSLIQGLAATLNGNEVKGKQIVIGNTTEAVPARGKGRKKVPAKDARTLAADRSAALVKQLEMKGVGQDALVAAAYSSNPPEMGPRLKARKTVILIQNLPGVQGGAVKLEPAPATRPSATAQAAAPAKPKAIPIQPPKPTAN